MDNTRPQHSHKPAGKQRMLQAWWPGPCKCDALSCVLLHLVIRTSASLAQRVLAAWIWSDSFTARTARQPHCTLGVLTGLTCLQHLTEAVSDPFGSAVGAAPLFTI